MPFQLRLSSDCRDLTLLRAISCAVLPLCTLVSFVVDEVQMLEPQRTGVDPEFETAS
jgi:hypothetical protein